MKSALHVTAITIAGLYLAAVLGGYFFLPFAYREAEVWTLLWLVTLPWSLVGSGLFVSVGAIPPEFMAEGFRFFVIVIASGGANAYLLVRLGGYRPSRREIMRAVAAGLLLAVLAQVTSGARAQAARDYRKPHNGLKTATLNPKSAGLYPQVYQACTYNTGTRRIYCTIWSYEGKVLSDEEYISLEAFSPLETADLVISDENRDFRRVLLRSGRTLFPKSSFSD